VARVREAITTRLRAAGEHSSPLHPNRAGSGRARLRSGEFRRALVKHIRVCWTRDLAIRGPHLVLSLPTAVEFLQPSAVEARRPRKECGTKGRGNPPSGGTSASFQ
jgi:hypothetical protein